MKKLRSRRGETLVETLVSLLIVVLVMAFLATSIVAATRVNAKMRDADVAVVFVGLPELAEAEGWGRENICLLSTSDAADERASVALGGRRLL